MHQREVGAQRRLEQVALARRRRSSACPLRPTVPTPVGVRTPPRPKPPARMRSISVPCGTRSTCDLAGDHLPLRFGIEADVADDGLAAPALRRSACRCRMPGVAVSLAMTVRSRLPWRTSSSISRSGVPTPMKPPIIRLAPSGIIATASVEGDSFHMMASSIVPSSRHRPASAARGSAPRRRSTGKTASAPDLLRRGEFERGLFLAEQLRACASVDRDALARGEVVDLLLHQRCQHPARADGVAGDARSSLSRARRPWSSRARRAWPRRRPTSGPMRRVRGSRRR